MSQTALITGASGGIGLEFARIFAQSKYNLVLVARSTDKLRQLADELTRTHGIAVKILTADLSKSIAPDEIYRALQSENIEVDILINNAGFALSGEFTKTDLATELDMIQVNITALTHLTKLFLRDMVRRNSGKILNVASTAGFQPGPLFSVYFASKAYVIMFSEALANEVHGTGVTVSVLCPGPTKTDFEKRAGMGKTKSFSSGVMDAATCARIGYEGLMKGKTTIIAGLKNKLLVQSVRFAPRSITPKIARSMMETKES
jgi:uncharacterized protein